MRIEDEIIYGEVTYPKDVKEIYQQAKDQMLKGYSAKSADGRYFKWNCQLNKAEVTGAEVIYFDGTKGAVVQLVEAALKTPDAPEEDSKRVAAVRYKIQNYKNQVEALSASLASANTRVAELEKCLAEKEEAIAALEEENKELKAEFDALQSDLDDLEAL